MGQRQRGSAGTGGLQELTAIQRVHACSPWCVAARRRDADCSETDAEPPARYQAARQCPLISGSKPAGRNRTDNVWRTRTRVLGWEIREISSASQEGGEGMIRVKKILYPTDFSSYSNQAYFHAVALAENHHASLTILFVYTPDMVTPGQPPDEAAASATGRTSSNKSARLTRASPVHHVLLDGNPAQKSCVTAATPTWT